MTQQLPTRPFTPLPPPPGGIAQAVRTGRRMRLRRRLAVAGGALSAVAVVAAAAVFGPASTGATDQLVPAAPGVTTPTASPAGRAVAPGPATPDRPAATPAGRSAPVDAAVGPPGPGSSYGPAGSAKGAQATASPAPTTYRTPALVRQHVPPTPRPPGSEATLCSGSSEGGSGTLSSGVHWCVNAVATGTSRGHDLTLRVCRDSTGGARMHFTHEQEAELTVLRGDQTIWRWSRGHPNDNDAHGLDVEAEGCWTWTAPWTDVDATGRPLAHGQYTLTVATTATGVGAPQSTAFSID